MAGGLIQDIIIGNFWPSFTAILIDNSASGQIWKRKIYTPLVYIFACCCYGNDCVLAVLQFDFVVGGSHYLSYSYFLSLGIPLTFLNGLSSIILYNLLWRMKRESEPKW